MEKRFKKVGLLVSSLIGLSAFIFSCSDSSDSFDSVAQLNKDIAEIDAYLTANGIEAEKDVYGIRMQITELGTGLPAQITNGVDIDYTGRLFTTNAIFDADNAKGTLSTFIDGWKVAFTTLPVGSKARLFIPSPLAYGNVDQSTIPANSILVFDVEFNSVSQTSTELAQFKTDTTAIRTYINTPSKNITGVTKDATGVFYKITQEGSGSTATWYDRISLSYTIKLMSDDSKTVVDIDDRKPTDDFYSRVVDYIHGMKVGLMKMSVGSKATLYIPSVYGFGAQDATSNGYVVVPANSNLIVDIEVTDID